ncbi:MAG: MFS transporter [Chloroflexi bacterium]|nr:MAG: MFS transporter [Chloroflexota bacterium]
MIQRAAYPGVGVVEAAVAVEPAILLDPAPPAGLRRKWAVLAVLLAAPFLAVLDAFVVLVAVPSIQDQLHASDAGVQLVVAGYGVAYAAFLIAGGRLGDIHGRRKLLVVGMVLFVGTSLLAAAAPNEVVLVVARILQGAAAGRSAWRWGEGRSRPSWSAATWSRPTSSASAGGRSSWSASRSGCWPSAWRCCWSPSPAPAARPGSTWPGWSWSPAACSRSSSP